MVVTRSFYKKSCEGFNKSDVSEKNIIIPPWCSSGKVYERRKSRKLSQKWEIRSTYPLRENIWEYLYEDNVRENFNCRRTCKHTGHKKGRCKSAVWMFALICGVTVSAWLWKITANLQSELSLATFISLPNMKSSTSVGLECCQRMKYLAEQLAKAEQSLRNSLRLRSTMLTSSAKTVTEEKAIDTLYIQGAMATKGSDTKEWGGRVALWGVIPLWHATRSPDTVLALRRPTASDCWPFIGSQGEIIIELPQIQQVSYVAIEHIYPDTARSAPKHFVIYGILSNDTSIKVAKGQYRAEGPVKQYYPLAYKHVMLKTLAFRILSNQGNNKYTCIYRIHLYGNVNSQVLYNNKV